MSLSTTTKKSSTLKNIGKSINKTLKSWGLYRSKHSSNDKIIKELQNLPEAPTKDIRASLRERKETIEKVQREIREEIRTQEKRKKELQDISRKIGTLKTGTSKRMKSHMDRDMHKRKEIADTVQNIGLPITTDARTLQDLQRLPPPPTLQNRTYGAPSKIIEISEEDLEKEFEKGGRKKGKKSRKVRFGK
jgi:TolA-binding protein